MTERNSTDYYRSREEQERRIADAAVDPGIAAIHRDMADRYALLVGGPFPARPQMIQRILT